MRPRRARVASATIALIGALTLGASTASAAPPEGSMGELPATLLCPRDVGRWDHPAVPCVTRDGGAIAHAKVDFSVDKATIRPQSFASLDALAELLVALPSLATVEIAGHRDSVPDRRIYGRDLSMDRARSVRAYLVQRGVAADRLVARGYGETMPLVPNDTPERRALNRRVEVNVLAWRPVEHPAVAKDCGAPCAADGLCLAWRATCLPSTDAGCAASELCRERGGCARIGTRCGPASDAHCARTSRCRERGECGAAGPGRCAAREPEHCADSDGCRDDGLCSVLDGRCRRVSNEDCRRSRSCREAGLCAADRRADHGCVARYRKDCRASERCRTDGLCAPAGGRCVARTNADCRRSEECARAGLCTATRGYDDGGSCVVGSHHDCRRSAHCQVDGRCVRQDHFNCVSASPAER